MTDILTGIKGIGCRFCGGSLSDGMNHTTGGCVAQRVAQAEAEANEALKRAAMFDDLLAFTNALVALHGGIVVLSHQEIQESSAKRLSIQNDHEAQTVTLLFVADEPSAAPETPPARPLLLVP